MKDCHTKYVWLFAIKSKDAVTVADQLVTELYCRWGLPQLIVSDRGTEFRNKIHHIFRGNKIATTPYNARSNGCVENHNRTLKDQLYHFVEARHKNWDIFLPTVQLMYNNTTVNSATGYTPYFLMFGRECNMPGVGNVIERVHERVGKDDGEAVASGADKTVQDQWIENLVQSLELAWKQGS